jgi:hypothetical protein
MSILPPSVKCDAVSEWTYITLRFRMRKTKKRFVSLEKSTHILTFSRPTSKDR